MCSSVSYHGYYTKGIHLVVRKKIAYKYRTLPFLSPRKKTRPLQGKNAEQASPYPIPDAEDKGLSVVAAVDCNNRCFVRRVAEPNLWLFGQKYPCHKLLSYENGRGEAGKQETAGKN